jgi:hypothetical protein
MQPLKLNSQSPLVAGYKKALLKLGFNINELNNIFDSNTQTATVALQKSCNIKSDGIAGENTFKHLILNLANKFTLIEYNHLFNAHKQVRHSGNPVFPSKINEGVIFGFRCNLETDANLGKWNDTLVFIKLLGSAYTKIILECTADPAIDKYGVAHLRQGVWNSYVVRPHRWQSTNYRSCNSKLPANVPRWAFCQDLNPVEILRTNGNGKVISNHIGYFGINIHESAGDTSLGCTIPRSRCEWVNKILPLIYDVNNSKHLLSNHNNLSYCLINYDKLLQEYI